MVLDACWSSASSETVCRCCFWALSDTYFCISASFVVDVPITTLQSFTMLSHSDAGGGGFLGNFSCHLLLLLITRPTCDKTSRPVCRHDVLRCHGPAQGHKHTFSSFWRWRKFIVLTTLQAPNKCVVLLTSEMTPERNDNCNPFLQKPTHGTHMWLRWMMMTVTKASVKRKLRRLTEKNYSTENAFEKVER